mmetsp:Transcript_96633/g.268645  ORF Transcript_96633/g.268645 Transcript_96633/m.268645 type:complete len:215 (+) Transcript_96633:1391-2035(+)
MLHPLLELRPALQQDALPHPVLRLQCDHFRCDSLCRGQVAKPHARALGRCGGTAAAGPQRLLRALARHSPGRPGEHVLPPVPFVGGLPVRHCLHDHDCALEHVRVASGAGAHSEAFRPRQQHPGAPPASRATQEPRDTEWAGRLVRQGWTCGPRERGRHGLGHRLGLPNAGATPAGRGAAPREQGVGSELSRVWLTSVGLAGDEFSCARHPGRE